MALQGTIDSFALADVLRLLCHSRKTGRLIVNGERGTAHLWLVGGGLVGGDTVAGPVADPVELVFDVLRFEQGSFIFEADRNGSPTGDPVDLDQTLAQAEAALVEWREVQAVVPSLHALVTLSPRLIRPEVVVDQAAWSSIVAVGSGRTVGELGDALGLTELPVSHLVRALHEAGFVDVTRAEDVAAADVGSTGSLGAADAVIDGLDDLGDPGPPHADEGASARPADLPPIGDVITDVEVEVEVAVDAGEPVFDPSAWEASVADEPYRSVDPIAAATVDEAEVPSAAWATDGDPFADLQPFGVAEAGDQDPTSTPAPAPTLSDALSVPGDDELARQMAMLSPKAARAIVAASSGDDDPSDPATF